MEYRVHWDLVLWLLNERDGFFRYAHPIVTVDLMTVGDKLF